MADQHLSVLRGGACAWPTARPFTFRLESEARFRVTAQTVTAFTRSVNALPGGCWQWTDRVNDAGYGRFRLYGHFVSAHRFAYAAFVDAIPAGLDVDHICFNPACVRPAHLEPVTRRENNRRRAALRAQIKFAKRRARKAVGA